MSRTGVTTWPPSLPHELKAAWIADGLRTGGEQSGALRWSSSDNPRNYKPAGNRYAPESFDYTLNGRGFRCDSFDHIPPPRVEGGPPRVLFMGCSNTYGVGLPQEDVWAQRVRNAVAKRIDREDMPYWNVSEGGRSLGWIARMSTLALPMLRPDVVVVLIPAAHRREIWQGNMIRGYLPASDLFPPDLVQAAMTIWTPEGEYLDWARDLALLGMTCARYGARLLWDTWASGTRTEELLDNLPRDASESWRHFDFQHSRSFGKARDSIHSGHEVHHWCADVVTPLVLEALASA